MRKEIKIEGLENVHPLNESGEGTVFRGRRVREIDTVVKILPYPVHLRKKEDPATVVYLREVKRLRHLNQVFNLHVVKILNTGLNEKDQYPFIETELVKGPDLEELMTFPNRAVFRIAEVIDLATQMADALAHCHTALVKHGRINSTNIRMNSETGSYTLLNFGRVLLTEEQRKAEVINSRAPEYLAPEQDNGEILFETDIYSLGIVLFQVLTGTLPGRSPGAGSQSGTDTAPAISIGQQIKEHRKDNLPLSWTDAEKTEEMNIPVWLLNIVAICLQEDPSKRYSNGIKLLEAIKTHTTPVAETVPAAPAVVSQKPANDPPRSKDIVTPAAPVTNTPKPEQAPPARQLSTDAPQPVNPKPSEQPVAATAITSTAAAAPVTKPSDNKPINSEPDKPKEPDDKDAEIKRLKALIIQKEGQLDVYKYQTADYNPDSNKLNISRPIFFGLLAVIALLGALAVYSYFFRKAETRGTITTYTDSDTTASDGSDTAGMVSSEMYADSLYKLDSAALVQSLPPIPEEEKKTDDEVSDDVVKKKTEPKPQPKKTVAAKRTESKPSTASTNRRQRLEPEPDQNPEYFEPKENKQVSNKYTLAVPKAYFYDKPDMRSRRPVYLSNINESELTASEDTNGFIYVVFFNTDRQITKGWLRKSDLRRIN